MRILGKLLKVLIFSSIGLHFYVTTADAYRGKLSEQNEIEQSRKF